MIPILSKPIKKKLFIATIILFLLAFIIANVLVFFPSKEPIAQPAPAPPKPQTTILPSPPPPQPSPPQEEHQSEELAYVINQLSNDVWLLNLESGRAITRIPVGKFPSAGYYTNNKLYVTNTKDNTISVIDTTTNTLFETIPTEKSPVGIVVIGDEIFVANRDEWTITAINQKTKEKKQVSYAKRPTQMIFDPNKNIIYASSSFSNEVYVINPNIKQVAKKIEVGTTPEGIALSHDGKYLLTANKDANDVSIVLLKLSKEKKRVPTEGVTPLHAAFTKDDQFAWITNMDTAEISILSMFQEEIISNLTLRGAPADIHILDNKAYIASYTSHTIEVLDTQNLKFIDSISTGLGPIDIVLKENP